MIIFGPVPSRRLGNSLGINNIPPKICTYSCVYCQVGKTSNMLVKRRLFYEPEKIFQSVEMKCKELKREKKKVDYLTFVPDGEPTLDLHLGDEIEHLKALGIKIAVITNSSLIWREDVRFDLYKADWVSLKIDAVNRNIWRKIDRPHGTLNHEKILKGISEFSNRFNGELTTETMLIKGINDHPEEIEKISDFIAGINPSRSYISIPTRPPAEKSVQLPSERKVNLAFQVFKKKSIPTEYLTGYEGNDFVSTGNIEEDLLSITAVHPMREDGVRELLKRTNSNWSVVERLILNQKLIKVKYERNNYYLRKFRKKSYNNNLHK